MQFTTNYIYIYLLLYSYGDKRNADVAGDICGELLEEYGDDFSEEVIRSMYMHYYVLRIYDKYQSSACDMENVFMEI